MAKRKCKCKICKSDLTTDTAYKVVKGGKNHYYCDIDEYLEMEAKKKIKNDAIGSISLILGYGNDMISPPILLKKLNSLNKVYGYDVILETFIKNKDTLSYWWNLEGKFDSEYGKISYIMRIIENNINDVYKEMIIKSRIEKKMDEKSVVQEENISNKKIINSKDISMFLEE